jgi:hypothetical protein
MTFWVPRSDCDEEHGDIFPSRIARIIGNLWHFGIRASGHRSTEPEGATLSLPSTEALCRFLGILGVSPGSEFALHQAILRQPGQVPSKFWWQYDWYLEDLALWRAPGTDVGVVECHGGQPDFIVRCRVLIPEHWVDKVHDTLASRQEADCVPKDRAPTTWLPGGFAEFEDFRAGCVSRLGASSKPWNALISSMHQAVVAIASKEYGSDGRRDLLNRLRVQFGELVKALEGPSAAGGTPGTESTVSPEAGRASTPGE